MCRNTVVVVMLFALLLVPSTGWSASSMRGFPVRLEGTVEVTPPLAVDVDADGRLEIAVATLNRIFVFKADGSTVPGFPLDFEKGAGVATPLTAGPVGPDSSSVLILFGSENSKLQAFNGAGKAVAGFLLQLPAPLAGAPTLGDVNGDSSSEIVFGTRDGKVHAVDGSGRELAGYPFSAGGPVSSAVTVGRFRPGAPMVLLFGDERGRLHAFTAPGKELPGFPTEPHYTVASQPVLGDIDDDGSFEVVFGCQDFKIYAIKEDGSVAPGFPVATGYRIYSTPALADIDGDGVTDIVVASGDGKVYVLGKGGKPLPGFPVAVGQRLRGSPVVGDVDLDGLPEIAVGTDRGNLVLLRSDGKAYAGFPIRMEDQVAVAPLLADLGKDGSIELVTVSRNGTLDGFRMLKKGKGVAPLAWPAEGHDSAHRGFTFPNPPRYTDLKIAPDLPKTDDPLRLAYRFHDLDGDPEPATVIQWFRNGKRVPELDGLREVPPAATTKHERWHFTLQAEPNGRMFTSPVATILNTPPGPPQVAIQPDPPRRADNLTLKIVREAADLDGDKVKYSITWLKDRTPVKGLDQGVVPAVRLAKGQRWTVVVTPNDGEAAGAPARASVVVANTPPGAPVVRLEPVHPTVTQDVRAILDRQATDPDGDKVSYHYLWEANGKPLDLRNDAMVMPAGFVSKHGKVKAEVVSFDGVEEGGKAEALAEVVNTAPAAPQVHIVPAAPRAGDDLKAEIQKPALDPDRDAIRYSFLWQRKGAAGGASKIQGPVLPATETHKGDIWTVRVTPSDSEGSGPPAGAEAKVGNTPPEPPVVEAVNPRPFVTDDLVLKVVKEASDRDGDRVSNEVIWFEGQREVARGKDLWRYPAGKTRKHLRYLAKVVPSDGTDAGQEVRQGFEVQNTTPGRCQVAVDPAQPGTGRDLTARIVEKPSDPDGDAVQIRYRWYLDGEALENNVRPEQIEGRRVKRGQHWTVVATPFDGEAEGPACEASVVVINRAPSAPEVALEPSRPTTLDALALKVVKPATDPDDDRVTLRVVWQVDGQPFAAGDSLSVPEGVLKKGQRWTATVVATDGELQSQPVTVETRVVDSAPGVPRIEIQPASPLSSDDLFCRLVAPTPDPDGDVLEHSFAWSLVSGQAGKESTPEATGAVLPAAKLRKGQRWVCHARASDGETSGPDATASVVIGNAAPCAPVVEVQPDNPRVGETLRCVFTKASLDPDGDPVSYRFRWTKDGVVQTFAPNTDTVPARLTKEKDIWQCAVTASDGQLDSPWSDSTEVVVLPAPVTGVTAPHAEKS